MRLFSLERCALVLIAMLFCSRGGLAAPHEFRLKRPDAQSVTLMAEFNQWKGQPMKKSGSGDWVATVSLPPGSYGYKFLVNGNEWILDPDNPQRKTVDGVENSSIDISAAQSATPRPSASATTTPGPPRTTASHVDFNVLAERTRSDFGRSGNEHTVTTKERWGYKVTIENKSFAAVSGLEVQYREFKFQDALRGSTQLVAVPGSISIAHLDTGQRFTFETMPVEMERLDLRPGWYYNDGAKDKVKDRLAGLWLRVLRDGEVIFEWQNPPDLKNTAKWE